MSVQDVSSVSFAPLTPTAFLRRSSVVHADRLAVVDGRARWSYAMLWEKSRRLAGALAALGVRPGDRVAVLAANSSLGLLAHYGVPLSGGVLVTLNIRLSAAELAYILGHADARILLCDADLAEQAAGIVASTAGASVRVLDDVELEALSGHAEEVDHVVTDERSLLSINYTSGTTGRPKGVMYHHRGAYLQSLAMALHGELRAGSVFLWVVPMFHCHGWCHTWAVTAVGARHVCLRTTDPARIWELIEQEQVTHLAAAPTVLTALAESPLARPRGSRQLRVTTGGAPPSPALLARLDELGVRVMHAYGLTETFGPVMLCDWHPEWDELPLGERARLLARQGVENVIASRPRVIDDHGVDVPPDGSTVGELVLRGNDVMLGYYRDDEGTRTAARDGHFRTGDLAVVHRDGYVELRDRLKDVIISGGENISSIEVEQAITSHPDVLEAAVVAVPDERWGERPAAFVVLCQGGTLLEEQLISHLRQQLAGFKVPRDIRFVHDLPKTATGKIQKFALRDAAWAGRDRRIG